LRRLLSKWLQVRGLGTLGRLGRIGIPILALAAAGWSAFDERSGIPAWRRMRSDSLAAHARIEVLRGDIEALRREADALAGDDFAVERAIREDLGLALPGESVVRLDGRRPGPGRR
jgi:cell division protein FtsB